MSVEHPAYWLVYVSEVSEEEGYDEVIAVAPEVLDQEQYGRDAQWLLAAADGFRVHHRHQRVVFVGEITRWLMSQQMTWAQFDVDLRDALLDLDALAPLLYVEAAPLTMAIVGKSAPSLKLVFPDGRTATADAHGEPVRAAIQAVLERDWPPFARSLS
jgi:hypothetical protein